MKILFDESFAKSSKKLNDRKIKEKIIALIASFEGASSLSE